MIFCIFIVAISPPQIIRITLTINIRNHELISILQRNFGNIYLVTLISKIGYSNSIILKIHYWASLYNWCIHFQMPIYIWHHHDTCAWISCVARVYYYFYYVTFIWHQTFEYIRYSVFHVIEVIEFLFLYTWVTSLIWLFVFVFTISRNQCSNNHGSSL